MDSRQDRDRTRYRHDPVWEALGGLRDSDVVHEARRFAASRVERRERWLARLSPLGWSRLGFAGVMALLLALLLWPAGDVVQTGVGEIRRATLADGTVVMLNTDSELRVRFGAHAREVTLLAGQARFDVAHDASRPFRVTAGGMTVTAVGTAFDVVALPGRTAVTLIEGKVVVEAQPSPDRAAPARTMLAPGQQVAFAAGALTKPRAAKLDAALAWQRQLVDVSSMTLAEALDEVNRYSEVKVVLAEESLAREQMSGVFKAGDVEAVAAALRSYFGLSVIRRDDREIVLGQGASGGTADGRQEGE